MDNNIKDTYLCGRYMDNNMDKNMDNNMDDNMDNNIALWTITYGQ